MSRINTTITSSRRLHTLGIILITITIFCTPLQSHVDDCICDRFECNGYPRSNVNFTECVENSSLWRTSRACTYCTTCHMSSDTTICSCGNEYVCASVTSPSYANRSSFWWMGIGVTIGVISIIFVVFITCFLLKNTRDDAELAMKHIIRHPNPITPRTPMEAAQTEFKFHDHDATEQKKEEEHGRPQHAATKPEIKDNTSLSGPATPLMEADQLSEKPLENNRSNQSTAKDTLPVDERLLDHSKWESFALCCIDMTISSVLNVKCIIIICVCFFFVVK
eukprot:69018_1